MIAAIVLVAAVVRLYRIDLTWYFLDQVRDVSMGIGIATGAEWPLVGPLIGWTSGRLGPLYFYLIAPPFAIAPVPMAGFVWVALANVLAVFLCYRLAREYFGAPVALVAAALFATFPLAVSSGRVLWNPALVPLFTLLFMRALFRLVIDGRSRAFVALAAWLAVLTQIHLSTAALGIVAVIALAIWRPRIRLAHALLAVVAFLALYAPYLVHEATHRFENVRAIVFGFGTARSESGERALGSLLVSLAGLYRSAVDGFAVAEPWPPAFLAIFSLLYRIESVIFCLGVALCALVIVRERHRAEPEIIRTRRAFALLLLWLLVPVLLLGTRRTALWWYYLDLLYPSQFILAALILGRVVALIGGTTRRQRVVGWSATALVAAIAVVQAWFQIGLQQRIEHQGRLVFDVPRFSVAAAGSSLGTLPSLPYAYRARLLGALGDLGLRPGDFETRVHGPTMGRRDENDLLLRRLAPMRLSDSGAQFLVTDAADAGAGLDGVGATRVGPYAIVAYRPAIAREGWRCAVGAENWQPQTLPATNPATLVENQTLVCEGTLRLPATRTAVDIAVLATGPAPLAISKVEIAGRAIAPIQSRSWFSPSLYWSTEAVAPATSIDPGDHVIRIAVTGPGPVQGLDVYEVRLR